MCAKKKESEAVGRPSKYKEEYNDLARKVCSMGHFVVGLSLFFEVSESEIYKWIYTRPDFRESMISGYEDKLRLDDSKEVRLAKRRARRSNSTNRAKQNAYQLDRVKNIPKERLRQNFASLLRSRLKNKKPGVFSSVGYEIGDLMKHLESKFIPGMSWDNYGKVWHVDHIKPNKLFKYESQEDPDFKSCWALANLQPLFAQDNLKKGSKY
jgi:hypothetical protein